MHSNGAKNSQSHDNDTQKQQEDWELKLQIHE